MLELFQRLDKVCLKSVAKQLVKKQVGKVFIKSFEDGFCVIL